MIYLIHLLITLKIRRTKNLRNKDKSMIYTEIFEAVISYTKTCCAVTCYNYDILPTISTNLNHQYLLKPHYRDFRLVNV